MTVRIAKVKLGNGFTKTIKQDIPDGVDGRGADRIIAHTYGVDLNDVTHGHWGFIDNAFGGGSSNGGYQSDDWFWALLGGSLIGGSIAAFKLTKWAAPKIWKGCELAVQGTEWVLANTR